MVFPPLHLIGLWHRGLLTAGALGAGAYLLARWYRRHRILADIAAEEGAAHADRPVGTLPAPAPARHVPSSAETLLCLGGLALGAWCLGGGWLAARAARRHCPQDWPEPPADGSVHRLRRPDGTEIHVVLYGPEDAPPIVFVHGWGADHAEWAWTRRDLADRYRLITWDLPGLGRSTPAGDGDWSLERAARDLDAVLEFAGDRGAVLVGHSLGAMILLAYCRLFPEALGARVRGLVLAHVTYTDPARTTSDPALTTALRKPLFEPVCHLTIGLSPLVRVLAWLCYLNGSAHRMLEYGLFTGRESWEQIEFLARYYLQSSPAATARYTLAMFHFEADDVLPTISVPTLIVAGDHDQNCSPATHAYMARVIPGARLLMLRPARHGGVLEHYRTFDRALAEFTDACTEAEPAAAVG